MNKQEILDTMAELETFFFYEHLRREKKDETVNAIWQRLKISVKEWDEIVEFEKNRKNG